MAPTNVKLELDDLQQSDDKFYVKPAIRFVLQETPTGYEGVANISSGNSSAEVAAEYNEPGAAMYIVAVILVYGLSIVLLIGTLVRKNMRKSGSNFVEERQVSKYLQNVPHLKERSQRDQYRELKGHMQRIVESNEFKDFNQDQQRAHVIVTPVHDKHASRVTSAGASSRPSLGGGNLPAHSLLSNCNDILLASVLPQSVVQSTPEGATPPVASADTEREPFLRVSSTSAWGRTSIYSKRGSSRRIQQMRLAREAAKDRPERKFKRHSNDAII